MHPQVGPDDIKSREVELGLRVGLLSLQLFPNGGATDIIFVTLFCLAVGTAITWCDGGCAMPGGHCLINILLFWRRSTAALAFRVGACLEGFTLLSPFSHSSPSLTGLLASVDVKQQYSFIHSNQTQLSTKNVCLHLGLHPLGGRLQVVENRSVTA